MINESCYICNFARIEDITTSLQIRMTFLESWEEFEKAAERLYLQDPMKVRLFMA